MPQSSDYYARLIAEVTVVLADPEIACHPAGALASVQLKELCRLYVDACEREVSERQYIEERTAFHANRLAAGYPRAGAGRRSAAA